jgi:hypothetical protein
MIGNLSARDRAFQCKEIEMCRSETRVRGSVAQGAYPTSAPLSTDEGESFVEKTLFSVSITAARCVSAESPVRDNDRCQVASGNGQPTSSGRSWTEYSRSNLKTAR